MPSASKASVSSVDRTAPSIEFSKGTSARSASPSATARMAAYTLGRGSGSMSASRAAARSASSEKVPAGPRKATRIDMGAEGYGGAPVDWRRRRLAERELVGGPVVGCDRLAGHRQDGDLERELDVPLGL